MSFSWSLFLVKFCGILSCTVNYNVCCLLKVSGNYLGFSKWVSILYKLLSQQHFTKHFNGLSKAKFIWPRPSTVRKFYKYLFQRYLFMFIWQEYAGSEYFFICWGLLELLHFWYSDRNAWECCTCTVSAFPCISCSY